MIEKVTVPYHIQSYCTIIVHHFVAQPSVVGLAMADHRHHYDEMYYTTNSSNHTGGTTCHFKGKMIFNIQNNF